jgi:hypothetical protein
MATVARTTAPIQHYAYLGDAYGTAELLNGSGYLFRAEGERKATLVSYKNVNLMLYGRCDLADGQYITDELAGGPAWIATHRAQEVA